VPRLQLNRSARNGDFRPSGRFAVEDHFAFTCIKKFAIGLDERLEAPTAPYPAEKDARKPARPNWKAEIQARFQLEGKIPNRPQLERFQLDNARTKGKRVPLTTRKAVAQLERTSLISPYELRESEFRPYELTPSN